MQGIWIRSLGQEDSPGEGNTPVFLPGKSHRQRGLVGYSPWDGKESDTTVTNTFSIVLVLGPSPSPASFVAVSMNTGMPWAKQLAKQGHSPTHSRQAALRSPESRPISGHSRVHRGPGPSLTHQCVGTSPRTTTPAPGMPWKDPAHHKQVVTIPRCVRWCWNSVRLDFNAVTLDETTMGVQIEKRSKDGALECYKFNDWEQEEKSSKKIEKVCICVCLCWGGGRG